MTNDFVPVNRPLLNGNEKKYLIECIDSGWISSEGNFIQEFENQFAARVGRKFAIAVSNGTGAIDIAIEALSIGKGDEVIMPTFTIISCINQIIRSGATPIFIDSDLKTWNMVVSDIEACITRKTKAILVAHMYGLPVDMQPILRLAEKYNLRLIEDAAEMHGQTYMDRPCGSFGDISTFSFYPNKHITTGEGGMVLTDSDELAKQCRSLRNLCMQDGNRFVHERLGWNLRMTNMQAALGLAQLERLDDFINIKRNMAKVYFEGFEDLVELQLPVRRTDYAENIYWVFGILLNSAKTNLMAKEVIEKLNNQNIGARPFFYPMHLQPVLKNMGYKFDSQKLKNSEELYNRGFYIPSGLGNTGEEQIKVIKALRGIFQK